MRCSYITFASPFLLLAGNAGPAKRPHGRLFKESLRELRGRSVEARAAMDAKIDICIVPWVNVATIVAELGPSQASLDAASGHDDRSDAMLAPFVIENI